MSWGLTCGMPTSAAAGRRFRQQPQFPVSPRLIWRGCGTDPFRSAALCRVARDSHTGPSLASWGLDEEAPAHRPDLGVGCRPSEHVCREEVQLLVWPPPAGHALLALQQDTICFDVGTEDDQAIRAHVALQAADERFSHYVPSAWLQCPLPNAPVWKTPYAGAADLRSL